MEIQKVTHEGNRLGKCIEKFASGEIRKCADGDYFIWKDDQLVARTSALIAARKLVNIVPSNRKASQTAPKSSYPQNQKGYRADSVRSKSK